MKHVSVWTLSLVMGLLTLVVGIVDAQTAQGASAGATATAAATGGAIAPVVDERVRLALADSSYPVTPGDVYQLTFLQGVQVVTTQLIVEGDYDIYMGIFGQLNARGKRYSEIKPQIEQIVADAYPRGLPSVTITSIGLFQVTLIGAIPRSTRATAWGFSRLSDLIEDSVGPFTSLRDVEVRSAEGNSKTYDVFKAIYQGDSAGDPRLRPGDTVVFGRQETTVTVTGAVYEAGDYELRGGEGLSDLVSFSQGLTPDADPGRLVVERRRGDAVVEIALGTFDQASEFDFEDGDVLTVPEKVVPHPVVFVEGAVRTADAAPTDGIQDSTPSYNRITSRITAGETLYTLLLNVQNQISPYADLEHGYVVRSGQEKPLSIDMMQVLYRNGDYTDFPLQAFDRIVIPLVAPDVLVSGDVPAPGRYSYDPFRKYDYYLRLAGTGIESLSDIGTIVQIYDRDEKLVPADTTIGPGYTIHVPTREDRFVVVSGDVPNPGAYVFESARDYSYYVRLAGVGANAFASVRNTVELYDPDGNKLARDAAIQPDYTIYVPPTEPDLTPDGAFVLVTGAVNAPGRYELFGERGASYYLLQAGGVNSEVSADGTYTIRSAQGEIRSYDAIIEPGDTIDVKRNGFVYNFNRYFPVITSGLTFITTLIAIIQALNGVTTSN